MHCLYFGLSEKTKVNSLTKKKKTILRAIIYVSACSSSEPPEGSQALFSMEELLYTYRYILNDTLNIILSLDKT